MDELFRRIGGFIRRVAPVLRSIARRAAPILGAAAIIGMGIAVARKRGGGSADSEGSEKE